MINIIDKLKLNEEASSGGLAGLALNFVFFSFICLIMGKVFDMLVRVNNSFIGMFNLSGDAINTMNNLSMIFTALPFIYLIFLIINHIVISNRSSTGEV
jgi:hypothetical protein